MGGMTCTDPPDDGRQKEPQWSPPVMGGMTSARHNLGAAHAHWPQWSPPVMGGMTRRVETAAVCGLSAAMEPARNGRDDGRLP